MIQVVTHNGQTVAKGGKRLGYLFTQADGGVGVVPASIAWMFKKPEPSPKPALPLLTAQRDRWGDARCPSCQTWNENLQVGKCTCISCRQAFQVIA